MKKIFKYILELKEDQTIEMPADFEILSIQMQNGLLTIWAVIDDTETGYLYVSFKIIGTGHKIPEYSNLKYIATVQDGSYVWHIFRNNE